MSLELPAPIADPDRLAAIEASALLDAGACQPLDRVVRTAARLLDVPVCQLNVVTAELQVPVSNTGGEAWGRSVDLGHSFCGHVVAAGEPLLVADARSHPVFQDSPLTRDGGAVGYMSVPIRSPRADHALATLCVVDYRPRAWTDQQLATLQDLAAWALSEIELLAAARRERRRSNATEAHLRAIYDGSFQYIGLLSPDGRIVDTNRASLAFAGSARDDVLGLHFWDAPWFAHTPGAPERLRESVDRAARGEVVRYEVTLNRPAGDALTFDFSLHPVHDEGGEVIFIIPEGRDITERKRAEAALELERRRLEEVILRAPAFMSVLRADGYILELANDRYLELIGHRDAIGKPLFDVVSEAKGQGFEELLDRVVETGEPFLGRGIRVELQNRAGGPPEERVLDLSYVPLTEPDGRPTRIIALGTDVTEQVQAREDAERARARAERLQSLTEALARARTLEDVADVVVADMVVALNALTGSLAGRAPDGDAMILLRTIGFPSDIKRGVQRQPLDLQSPLTECFRTQAPVWIEQRDGPAGLDARYPPIAAVWNGLGANAAAFVPLDVAGETVGVISFSFAEARTFADDERSFLLTLGRQAALAVERARLFEAEQSARADAERANQAKSQFLAVMSHELRTPLNAIGGYVELLQMGIRGPVTEDQRQDLRRIQMSQRHLTGLINEVLNFTKLETGSVHFDFADVPLRDALAAAEALLATQATARGLELRIGPVPRDLLVRADSEKLRQVLVNLLANAVKFTERGGRIDVTCTADAEAVTVDVRDTGIGIPADQVGRIFEPFVQVRADLTRTAEGTGLGLAISRDLARAMDGDIVAESEEGVGSVFRLRLPLAGAG